MPISRASYVPIPAAIPRHVSDTRTLGDLLRRRGEVTLQHELTKGQSAALLWAQLGRAFSNFSEGKRADKEQAAALELRRQEKDAVDQLKRDELADRKAEREEVARLRKEAEERQQRLDAEKRGTAVAEEVGYGPMSEPQMEAVLESPAGGRARYVFGPGTAEGPELQPTKEQAALAEFAEQIANKGGIVNPATGAAVMPPAPPREPNPTEASLALMAAKGDRGAQRALEIIAKHREASREPKAPPVPPKMAAGTADKVAMAQTSIDALDTLEALVNRKNDEGTTTFREELMGPWAGRYNAAERGAPGVVAALLPDAPEGFEDFAAETATLKNQVIQAITGAAVGVQEQGRIMAQIPDTTDTPKNWLAKAKATRRNLQRLMANQVRMGTGAQGPLMDGTTVEVNLGGGLENPFRKK